jgi:hypothetical protein
MARFGVWRYTGFSSAFSTTIAVTASRYRARSPGSLTGT